MTLQAATRRWHPFVEMELFVLLCDTSGCQHKHSIFERCLPQASYQLFWSLLASLGLVVSRWSVLGMRHRTARIIQPVSSVRLLRDFASETYMLLFC